MAEESSKAASTGEDGTDQAVLRRRIAFAAMDLAGTEGWSRLSLSRIAEAAGVGLAEVQAVFPVKAAILDAFMAEIDQQVLSGGVADADDAVRDRLFEVLMRRFEALAPYKAGVAAVLRDVIDPTVGLIGVPCFLRSMAWMLEAAGLSSGGIMGLARLKGLALIDANTARVWLRDDSPDMAKTMAALDRGLRRAESVIGFCCSRKPGPKAAETALS